MGVLDGIDFFDFIALLRLVTEVTVPAIAIDI